MKTILVIEDNREVRENIAELLMLNQYDVLTADNGRAGYWVAAKEQPDLVICDMVVPESGGRCFMQLIDKHEYLQDVPVLFFSAGTALPAAQKKFRSASHGFIKKPFAAEELLDCVKQTLRC